MMSSARRILLASPLMIAAAAACGSRPADPPPGAPSSPSGAQTDAALARDLGRALLVACPPAPLNDEAARQACAQRLDAIPELTSRMKEPFLWGGQASPTASFEEGAKTSFNPLAWRKMYLSLEMFTGEVRVESAGPRTLLHLAANFRSALDAGEYPYPFWHSKPKWDSYQRASEIIFVIESGQIIGALRSAAQDATRPGTPRTFDGNWVWKDPGGGDEPAATLYTRLFSANNPHVTELDHAYRAFEAEARQYNCSVCHRPDNLAKQRPLEILLYPNQALTARHELVSVIEERKMPPPGDAGVAAGITDGAQRQRLVELARAFEKAADAALASEPHAR